MNNKREIVGYYFASFLIIVIFIFIFAILYFQSLETEIEQFVSYYGYMAVFIFSFLVDVIMQPIGPDLVIASGIIIGLNISLVFFVASFGSILASLLGYWLGKKYGKIGFAKLFGENRFEKFDRYYKKFGKYALFVASLTPVPYVPFCWASGIFNIRIRTFTYFGIIPRILRFLVVALIIGNIS